jgi:hypothetical protein
MITDTLKEIENTKSKLAELQKKADTERSKQLNGLHTSLGFASREELISALRSLDGAKAAKGRPGRKPKAAASAPAASKKRSKRARITDDTRQQIVAALKGGAKGTQVAKDFGISLPSLQNIKKAAGLTKNRK